MGDLLNIGIMPLNGLLNRSLAGLSDPMLMSVDHICNKEIDMSALVSWNFFMVLINKIYACLYLSISVVIIR